MDLIDRILSLYDDRKRNQQMISELQATCKILDTDMLRLIVDANALDFLQVNWSAINRERKKKAQ